MFGEGGDDIMVGSSSGVNFNGDKYRGQSGFDWATFKNEAAGVGIDMNLRAFLAPVDGPVALGVAARFDAVEGLSGSRHSDLLRGDDADAITIPLAGAQGSVLKNFDLISGLRAFVGAAGAGPDGILGTADDQFGAGNILLGGQDSDIIEGRAGDDLIDGDRWLNVRISVRQNLDGTGPEIASFDSMVPLIPLMVNGTYNPGQLVIQREILPSSGFNFDTAWFSGPEANYTVTTNADGSVTVTDTVGTDGTDRLTGIERLQFADLAVVLAPGLNNEPVGSLTVSDTTPRVGQTLTVSGAGLFDADNTATNGAVPGPYTFFWQVEARAGSGIFEDIIILTGLGAGNATGPSFTVTPDLDGLVLRVRGIYQDQHGVLETVFSAQTAPVALVGVDNNAPVGTVLINDTTPTEGSVLTATNAFTDPDGIAPGAITTQWQAGTGGIFTNIAGATGTTFTPTQAQVGLQLRAVSTYTDNRGTLEQVLSAPTSGVGDLITGTAAADTLTGTPFDDNISGLAGNDTINGLAGNDILNGGAGVDTISGGAGDDTLTGGAGNDTLNGDAGNDTFLYTIGDGADTVNGGLGTDTLAITGTAVANTLNVVFDGTALITVEGGTVTGVETATADLLGGTDTLNYGTTTAAVTVNLGARTASGFASITNIENVTGGSGADRFIATVGDGNNTYTGGVGVDTYDLSLTTAGATFVSVGATGLTATSADIGTDTLATVENIIGSQGNDVLTGTNPVNVIDGQAGDDTIHGGLGADVLNGGLGNDTFTYTMGDGSDTVDGGAGLDTLNITGLAGNDTLDVLFNGTALTSVEGGPVTGVEAVRADLLGGTDTLNYGATTAAVTVNLTSSNASGFATINGITNIENVTGGAGADTLTGSALANIIDGGAGNDALSGGAGNDTLTGGTGDDRFIATIGDGNDTYTGGAGSDTYDLSLTSAGAAVTTATATSTQTGADTLATIENIIGSQGNDTITFAAGANVLDGQGGNDIINAGTGNDTLNGGLGNDTLNGEGNTDTLTGGGGDDTFVFTSTADAGNGAGTRDVITDFEGAGVAGGDVINVNAIDANAGVGGNQNFTFIGTAAFTAAGQLRYVQAAGITILEGNVNAALGADFQVQLTGTHNLLAVDFNL
jgi:Ca2+-binding RTX toxin-like protein